MQNLIYKEECYAIIGICMEVHNVLGPGLLEAVYKEAMEYEFQKNNIPFEREKKYSIPYKETILNKTYNADFVAFDEIILEVKAVKGAVTDHYKQTLNYMTLANSPIGMIINFGESSLKYKRVVR